MRSLELAVLLGGMLTADGRAQVGIGATPTTGNASQASTQTNPSLAGDKSSDGGRPIYISGKVVMQEKKAEYPGLYAHFHGLVAAGKSDADVAPLRIVADAFMLGKRIAAPEYIE